MWNNHHNNALTINRQIQSDKVIPKKLHQILIHTFVISEQNAYIINKNKQILQDYTYKLWNSNDIT